MKQKESPVLLEQHCVAHREALAMSQSYVKVPYLMKVEGLIKAIYSHFARYNTLINDYNIQIVL